MHIHDIQKVWEHSNNLREAICFEKRKKHVQYLKKYFQRNDNRGPFLIPRSRVGAWVNLKILNE